MGEIQMSDEMTAVHYEVEKKIDTILKNRVSIDLVWQTKSVDTPINIKN